MASLKDFGIYPLRGGSFSVGQHKTICPACSNRPNAKTDPSLSVHVKPDGFAFWNCHYCKEAGSTGARQLKTFQVTGTPVEPTTPFAELVQARKISLETLAEYQVVEGETFFPGKGKKPCLVMPYLSEDGKLAHMIKYRSDAKDFAAEQGGEPILFGMHLCDPAEPTLIIVEGEFDVFAGREAGLANVVSPPNSATGTMEWLQTCQGFMQKFKQYVIAVDNDDVGRKLKAELASRLGPENCSYIDWPEGYKDFNEVLQRLGKPAIQQLVEDRKPYPVDGIFDASEFFADLDDFLKNGSQRGLSTGFASLNEWYTIRPAEYTIVTGYPGSGKSEFVDQLMVNTSEMHGWKWGIASFENDPYEHIAKLIEKKMLGAIYKHPKMPAAHYQKGKAWVQSHFKWILKDSEQGAPTMDWIIEKMMVAHRQFGLNGFVIDPYNMLAVERGNMSETDHAGECLRRLRGFVKKTRAHVFLVCHPKVQFRDKSGSFPVPTMHDIAGGKNFFAMADNGLAIARIQDEDAVDVYVRKVRSRATGKAGGIIKLNWHPQCGRYYENFLTEPLSENVAVKDSDGIFEKKNATETDTTDSKSSFPPVDQLGDWMSRMAGV